jgi:hypothetical protein
LFRFGADNSEIANNYLRFKSSGTGFFDHNTVGQAFNFRVSASSALDTIPLVVNSTGIDVTGTVTANGLTFDGIGVNAIIEANTTSDLVSTTAELLKLRAVIGSAQTEVGNIVIQNRGSSENQSLIRFQTANAGTLATRMDIDYNGDISFYEDTGTTAKFFWDASAESLGIGTSLPIAALDVTGTDAVGSLTSLADTVTRAAAIVRGSTHANGYGLYMGYGNSSTDAQYIQSTLKTGSQAYPLLLNPYGGNVGIGTSSPAEELHITAAIPTIRLEDSDDGSRAEILYNVGSGGLVLRSDQGASASSTSNIIAVVDAVERLRITSDGNLGIGTSSPADLLDISANGTSAMRLSDSSSPATYAQITQANGVLTFAADSGNAQTGSNMQFEVDGTERMRIDASGNVGIGGTPTAPLHVFGGGILGANLINPIAFTGSGGTNAGIGSYTANSDFNVYSAGTGNIKFVTGAVWSSAGVLTTVGSERLRIDSLGNASFNTTDISPAVNNVFGTALLQYGGASMSRTNSTTLELNRSSSDGAIVNFRKDGTTVGSIGTHSQDGYSNFYIALDNASLDVGIGFGNAAGTGRAYFPSRDNGSGVSDVISIGTATYKYKDLFLSGGVYLGGTGAANLLDDYETGTWTPVFKRSGSTDNATIAFQDANYVKSGKQVTVTVYVTSIDYSPVTDGTFAIIEGLPFTSDGWHSGSIGYGGATNVSETTWVLNSVTGSFLAASGNGFYNGNPDLNRGMFTATYIAA